MSFNFMPVRKFVHGFLLVAGIVFAGPFLAGCDLTKNYTKIDRSANLEMQDYRDALAPRDVMSDEDGSSGGDGDIPALQPFVAGPSADLKAMPLVSISVNQTVPLRDALFELSEQAGYDLELDPRITGSVIFTARNRPFDVIVDRLCEIAGLRYKIMDGILRVELDTPYNKTYKIDYLSFIRKNKGSISNDVSVASEGGAKTGSGFEAESESEANFWGELDTNLKQLLDVQPGSSAMKTVVDPQITAAPPNPAPIEPVIAEMMGGRTTVKVTPPAATLQVNSLPTVDPASPAGGVGGAVGTASTARATYAMNKQAGIVSVYATEKQHKHVEAYLKELRRSVTAQVLIEAKILEVSLADDFATGIDWNQINLINGKLSVDFTPGGTARPTLPGIDSPADFTFTYNGGDVNSLMRAVSRFGTVQALASPRLMVLNNQSAVLNVANNEVYFKIDVETTAATSTSATQTTIDSEAKNVPEGVVINVLPSINLDDRSVSLALRPTVTRILKYVSDPAAEAQSVTSLVPVINVQEIDSVVKMQSGQAVVMGGLMQDETTSEQNGIPVLSEVPLLGSLFRTQSDTILKKELIIFLKATIVDGGNVHDTDKDIYRKFSADRRPFDM